jgi:ABC-type molybdate transport system substrate-binding protein
MQRRLLLLIAFAAPFASSAAWAEQITVMAAASLTDALQALGAA